MTIQREEEKSLLERLEGRWVRGDGQEMAELGPDGALRWSKATEMHGKTHLKAKYKHIIRV